MHTLAIFVNGERKKEMDFEVKKQQKKEAVIVSAS